TDYQPDRPRPCVACCIVPTRIPPHLDDSCEHDRTLAHSIVAYRSEGDDPGSPEGRERTSTSARPDYRKSRWRPAIHRRADKQYVKCASTNSRQFQAHSTTSIAQGSGDAE